MTTNILGQPVEFAIDLTNADQVRAQVTAMFEDMAGRINALADEWTDAEADVFRLIRKLVVFRKNKYRKKTMTRSYMAQKERTFFWTYDEFRQWEPGPRRPTAYYHDAWHVQQFLTQGDPPNDTEVLIDREQDAMVQQLAVASKLRCDASMIDFLQKYASDREEIRARLSQGVGFAARVRAHLTIVD